MDLSSRIPTMSSCTYQLNDVSVSEESKNGESSCNTTTAIAVDTATDGGTMSPPTIRSSQGNAASQTQGPQYAKVFVQRDYSDGTAVKFMTSFPQGLENKIERSVFEYTINQLNTYFAEAEKASCKTYCEGCFACFTVYTMFFCADTHYEKCLRKVGKFIVEQNEMVYLPRGLLLTNPAERGLRIIEITMLDQPIVART